VESQSKSAWLKVVVKAVPRTGWEEQWEAKKTMMPVPGAVVVRMN
jgi:hypothetical protein